jgi:acetyl esterase/lipase
MGHEFCGRVARELGALVVSVDYRLAPEHPFPTPLEDTYTGLRWLHAQARELGVDPARIAIGGESAGGGLAASLAQVTLDRNEVPVRFQLLVYPMLDDRTVLRPDHGDAGDFIWDPRSNRFAWTSYLGRAPVADGAPLYAAAARREDLTGLPSAWIGVGSIDLFHREDVTYAERLQDAGVAVELLVIPGMYHGADGFPGVAKSPSMTRFNQSKLDALRAALR